MNIRQNKITIGDLDVLVIYKDIKNLHLAVYPPDGRVRVAAPLLISDEAVRLAVINRIAWIKQKIEKFKMQPRQSKRELLDSESHYFQGERYRLNVIENDGKCGVFLKNKSLMELYVKPTFSIDEREKVLYQWYRIQLKQVAEPIFSKWLDRFGLSTTHWGIRKMKTKWGSCNPDTKRIWINLELVKKPLHCLEYIIIHELAHFTSRRHDDNFIKILDTALPQWRVYRDELNQTPLKFENWG